MSQRPRMIEYFIGTDGMADRDDLAAYFTPPHLTLEEKAAATAVLKEIDALWESSLDDAQDPLAPISEPLQYSIASCQARFGQICNQSHPVRRLPLETMAQIMEEASSSPTKTVLGFRSVRMEILMSHVCRHWRDIALSTPSLWTKIVGPDPGDSTRRVAAYLARSGGCLIDVRHIANTNVLGDAPPWGREFLMLAAQHGERWRSFTLNLMYAYFRDRVVADGLCNILRDLYVPELQHVDVSIDLPPQYAVEEPQIFLRGAPRLSTLKLDTALTSYWLLVPMKTITTLTLHFDCDAIPIIHLFSLPNLRHFAIMRRNMSGYYPLEFDLPDDEDSVPDALSELISLRLHAPDLPSLFELPTSLQLAFRTVRYLYVTAHGNLEDMDLDDEDEALDAWGQWPSNLQEELDASQRDIFPSLEHLIADLGWKGHIPALDIHPSLCCLTYNIRTLTIPDGYLNVDEEEGSNPNSKAMLWAHLRKVHFEELPYDDEALKRLAEWLAERGRQSGTLTVALEDTLPGLAWISLVLRRDLRVLMEEIRLEKAPHLSPDSMWPPAEVVRA